MLSVIKEEPLGGQGTSTSGFIVSRSVAGAHFNVVELTESNNSVRHGWMVLNSSFLDFISKNNIVFFHLL